MTTLRYEDPIFKGNTLRQKYEIVDKDGVLKAIHEHVRDPESGEKKCFWRRPNGQSGLNGTSLEDLPLYGEDRLDEEPVLTVLVEGEKARDALAGALEGTPGVSVVGTVTGATNAPSVGVLEVLRGHEVVFWADTDEPGARHAARVAERLQGIASTVRVYTWHEAPVEKDASGKPKGQDAADHPVVISGDEKEVGKLLNDLCGAPEYAPPVPDIDDDLSFHHIHGGFGGNKQPLPIKTVEELLAEAGEEVPWVVEDVLARGSLTDFSGLAKKGGKTTFWCHAIAAGARGDDHAGFRTEPAKYLYLTKQGNNFAQPLKESGLEEYPEHVYVIQFKDVSAIKWNELIEQAGEEAQRRGLDVLVVDTFAVFAGLKGSEENDSGPVSDRMRVLRLVAQKYDTAVLLIRHAGKDGTPRGSSAFEAEADICVMLSRPEGRHAPSVRKIAGVGRYGEWERNIQLNDGRFVSLGTDNKVEFNRAVAFVKAVLPGTPDGGMKKQEILEKRTGDDEGITASTLDRALSWLVKQGDVGKKQLLNKQGQPKVYWMSYKPTGGGEEDLGVCFHQTPSPNEENKPEPPTGPGQGVLDDYTEVVV